MKLAVQKNDLGGQILYRSAEPVKKRRLMIFLILIKTRFGHIYQSHLAFLQVYQMRQVQFL